MSPRLVSPSAPKDDFKLERIPEKLQGYSMCKLQELYTPPYDPHVNISHIVDLTITFISRISPNSRRDPHLSSACLREDAVLVERPSLSTSVHISIVAMVQTITLAAF